MDQTGRLVDQCRLLNNRGVDGLIKKIGQYALEIEGMKRMLVEKDYEIEELKVQNSNQHQNLAITRKILQMQENAQLRAELERYKERAQQADKLTAECQRLQLQVSQQQCDLVNSQIRIRQLSCATMGDSRESGALERATDRISALEEEAQRATEEVDIERQIGSQLSEQLQIQAEEIEVLRQSQAVLEDSGSTIEGKDQLILRQNSLILRLMDTVRALTLQLENKENNQTREIAELMEKLEYQDRLLKARKVGRV